MVGAIKEGSLKPEIPDEYKIFTPLQRRCIFAVVSLTGIISPLSSLIYTPALSTVATYLGVSIADVNLTITTYLILQGITPSIWGTLSDHYGRRLLYIVTLLIYVGACIGLSVTKSYGVVLALRALQAAGSSSTLALGSGVIRDLFAPSERGGYFGFYTAGIAVGTAFGPTLGGILAQYTGFHGLFLFLLGLSGTALLLIICLLPETHHSRIHGRHNPVPRIRRPIFTGLEPSADHVVSAKQSAKPPFNPFGPLKLLLQYDVLCCVSFTGICYTVWQNSMVATATIYADRYHLSQVQVGLTYISNGVGSVVGNLVVGKLLDYHYKQQLARENPDRETQRKDLLFIEHARLRSLKYAAPGFVGSVIALGWIMNSTVHISASIVFAFFLGWTDSSILTTYSTLMVDLFEDQASASSAAINLVRCLLGAGGTASVQPMINALGVGVTFTIQAALCVLCSPVIYLQYRYGPGWRAKRTKASSKSIDSSSTSIEEKTVTALPHQHADENNTTAR